MPEPEEQEKLDEGTFCYIHEPAFPKEKADSPFSYWGPHEHVIFNITNIDNYGTPPVTTNVSITPVGFWKMTQKLEGDEITYEKKFTPYPKTLSEKEKADMERVKKNLRNI